MLTAREGDEGSRRSADRTLTIGTNLNPTRVLFSYFLRLVNKKWEPQYKGQKGGKILKQNLFSRTLLRSSLSPFSAKLLFSLLSLQYKEMVNYGELDKNVEIFCNKIIFDRKQMVQF